MNRIITFTVPKSQDILRITLSEVKKVSIDTNKIDFILNAYNRTIEVLSKKRIATYPLRFYRFVIDKNFQKKSRFILGSLCFLTVNNSIRIQYLFSSLKR